MNMRKILLTAAVAIAASTSAWAQGCGGAKSFGKACNGFGLSCNGVWMPNQSVKTTLGLGPSGAVAVFMLGAGEPTTIDLTGAGAPGCSLYTSPLIRIPTVLVGDGIAQMSFPIPNDPKLVGTKLVLQGLVVDPQANALGMSTSNALAIHIVKDGQ